MTDLVRELAASIHGVSGFLHPDEPLDGWTEIAGCAYTRVFQSAPIMDERHS